MGNYKTYGSALTMLRKRGKMTGKQVAEQIGAPVATYYRYEKDPEKIPAHYLQSLCKLFDCTGEDILGLGRIPAVEDRQKDGAQQQHLESEYEDGELQAYLEQLRSRSEMRLLFSLAKDATKEDVERAARIIEALSEKT